MALFTIKGLYCIRFVFSKYENVNKNWHLYFRQKRHMKLDIRKFWFCLYMYMQEQIIYQCCINSLYNGQVCQCVQSGHNVIFQIVEKHWEHSSGHKFHPIFMNIYQNNWYCCVKILFKILESFKSYAALTGLFGPTKSPWKTD